MATKGNRNGHSVRLKAVGVSEDGLSLILATRANARTGSYRLAVDESLLEQLEEARARVLAANPEPPAPETPVQSDEAPETSSQAQAPPEPPRPKVDSKLSVREIQTLLRQGRSVASIAKKAAVDEAWIQKFEVPIVWERAGMAARARRSILVRSRSGASALPLGEAVLDNMRRRGTVLSPREFEAAWDSTRSTRRATWTVTFTFHGRGRPLVATWEYDPETGEVHPLNKLGGDLGWVQPRRRRATASA